MKTPHRPADSVKSGKLDGVLRETYRLPRPEARRRIKRVFKNYPTGTYLTEIESWDELPGGFVELTIKRRANVDQS